jgi:hypothetical protein
MIEAREVERHYQVRDGDGHEIRAVLHYDETGETTLSVKPQQGEKFWFERSKPELVLRIAQMIVEVAKDSVKPEPVVA